MAKIAFYPVVVEDKTLLLSRRHFGDNTIAPIIEYQLCHFGNILHCRRYSNNCELATTAATPITGNHHFHFG